MDVDPPRSVRDWGAAMLSRPYLAEPAAIEILSPAVVDRLCRLWAEPTDWGRLHAWLDKTRESIDYFSSHLYKRSASEFELRYTRESLAEMDLLRAIAGEHARVEQ